jgi:response regulator RpfG family c-di-GMP phosphodiesterase
MHKILLVDDDSNLLQGLKRQLRKRFTVDTAENAVAGIDKIISSGPYSVVISDYKMPKVTGVSFLSEVQKITPESTRILLTGFADLEIAIKAVNEGQIFRLLTKPCPPEEFIKALKDGIRQYELVTAEKDLLEKTLKGSIKVLSELLSLIKPGVYGRVSRILPYVKSISRAMQDRNPWQTETAAMLSLLGFIVLPQAVIEKIENNRQLDADELAQFNQHAEWCAELISNIPRLENVAEIIKYQDKLFDGSGGPKDKIKEAMIPLGARILRVVNDFDALEASGMEKSEALLAIKRRVGWYDQGVVNALELVLGDEAKYRISAVTVADLRPGMVLAENINFSHGGKQIKVLGKGQVVSDVTIGYLKRYTRFAELQETFKVIEPINDNLLIVD